MAELVDGGLRFRLSTGNWQNVYPIADLPAWLAFYREMRDRRAGRYAQFYTPTVAALEALQAQVTDDTV